MEGVEGNAGQDPLHLPHRQHGRHPHGPARPLRVDRAQVVRRQLVAEHLAVEEDQRVDRLVLAGRAEPAVEDEVVEERLHVRGVEVARVPPAAVGPGAGEQQYWRIQFS